MEDWSTFAMILSDDAHRMQKEAAGQVPPPPQPTQAEIFQRNFNEASKGGKDVILQISFAGEDLLGPVLYQTTIALNHNQTNFNELDAFFHRNGGRITGIYDLKKSFETARGDTALLPAGADQAIRQAIYDRTRPYLSLWQKFKFRDEQRRTAFMQSFDIYSLK